MLSSRSADVSLADMLRHLKEQLIILRNLWEEYNYFNISQTRYFAQVKCYQLGAMQAVSDVILWKQSHNFTTCCIFYEI